MDCPKLFPLPAPPQQAPPPQAPPQAPPPQAPPQPSPAPGVRRNTAALFTKERILRERKEAFKKTRAAAKRSTSQGGIRIRGRWVSTRELLVS